MEIDSPRFSLDKQEVTPRPRPPPRELKRDQGIVTELQQFIEKQKPVRRIRKLSLRSSSESESAKKELEDLPRFGPFYDRDDPLMLSFKVAAWQHVLSRSLMPEDVTTQIYMSAIQKVGKQARNTYSDDSEVQYHPHFISMMVKDGCFILQIALFLLGGGAQMNYPSNHLIFGEKRNTRLTIRKWAKSLFFVGNQVPQIVLKQLMKQTFFQQVLSSGSLKRPSDSFGRALYDILLEPEYRNSGLFKRLTSLTAKRSLTKQQQQSSDLLHGLHLRVTGAGDEDSDKEEEDEEDYDEVERDLEGNNEDSTSSTNCIQCATELRHSGIHFKKAKAKEGIKGIKFSSNVFRAVLALPTLEVDEDTQFMFRYLQNYEVTQSMEMKEQEVRSYIQFMSELVHTSDDANLLHKKGIILANRNQRKKLPAMLRNLASGHSTLKHRILRIQIDDYSRPPWDKLRNFLSIVVLLTVVQTVYTVLSYHMN